MHLTGRKNPLVKFGDFEKKNYRRRRTLLKLFFLSKNSKMDLGILPVCYTHSMLMTFFSLVNRKCQVGSNKTRQKPGNDLETNDIGTGIISSLFTHSGGPENKKKVQAKKNS